VVKGLLFALGSGMETRDRAMKYLYLLLRDIMWLHKTYQTLSNMVFWGVVGGYQIGDNDFTALVKHASRINGRCSGSSSSFSGCSRASSGGLSWCSVCECFVYAETTSAFTDATVARFGGDDV
jgi:hypothetical protein